LPGLGRAMSCGAFLTAVIDGTRYAGYALDALRRPA
jgi:hypothetical protein